MVDAEALRVLSSLATMNELVHRGIPVVEPLENAHRSILPMPAIYFITPSTPSIEMVVKDLKSSKPRYPKAHISTTTTLPDNLFVLLSQVESVLLSVKEANIEFLVKEQRVFQLLQKSLDPYPAGDRERLRMARQLSTLAPNAAIRFMAQSAEAKNFAQAYQQVIGRRTSPGADLILVIDRSIDPVAPLLHEFTYQAMAYDLLLKEDDPSYKFVYTSGSGKSEEREVLLTDIMDSMWAQLKHAHITEVISTVTAQLPKQLDRSDLAKTAKEMPEFTAKVAQCSVHLSLAGELMRQFTQRSLDEVAGQEQNMATGEASAQKRLANDLLALLDNQRVSHEDKVRLVMIFVICVGGVKDAQRKAIFSAAQLTPDEQLAVRNLEVFGVKVALARGVTKSSQKEGSRFAAKKKRTAPGETDVPFELSRYVPWLKDVVASCLKGSLNESDFPYLGAREAPAPAAAVSTDRGASGAQSLRSAASSGPRWGKRRGNRDEDGADGGRSGASGEASSSASAAEDSKPKLVIYVVGGTTFSETRCVYELAQDKIHPSFELVIGSDRIWTPQSFVHALEVMEGDSKATSGGIVATGLQDLSVEDSGAGKGAAGAAGSSARRPRRQRDEDAFALDIED